MYDSIKKVIENEKISLTKEVFSLKDPYLAQITSEQVKILEKILIMFFSEDINEENFDSEMFFTNLHIMQKKIMDEIETETNPEQSLVLYSQIEEIDYIVCIMKETKGIGPFFGYNQL